MASKSSAELKRPKASDHSAVRPSAAPSVPSVGARRRGSPFWLSPFLQLLCFVDTVCKSKLSPESSKFSQDIKKKNEDPSQSPQITPLSVRSPVSDATGPWASAVRRGSRSSPPPRRRPPPGRAAPPPPQLTAPTPPAPPGSPGVEKAFFVTLWPWISL